MKKLRKLSEIEFKHFCQFVGCYKCKEIFIYDLKSNCRSIQCPNGCGWVLEFGVDYEKLKLVIG